MAASLCSALAFVAAAACGSDNSTATAACKPESPEHVATTDEGHLLVVTSTAAPRAHVFYGTNGGTLFERTITAQGAESQDEGIMFKVDDAVYSVNFHYAPAANGSDGGTGQTVTGKLGEPGGTHALTILPLTTSLAGDTFECFSGP